MENLDLQARPASADPPGPRETLGPLGLQVRRGPLARPASADSLVPKVYPGVPAIRVSAVPWDLKEW